MENTYFIEAKHIDLQTISQIINKNYKIALSESAKKNIVKCRQYLDEKNNESDNPVYGINTGFGSLYNVKISKENLSKLQENLLLSHACGVGQEVPKPIVKLMLLFKAVALSYGYSGVQLQTVERILDFYNNDITPVVYQQGSLGASGDLAPLAHLFLPLIGRGEVYYQNKKFSANEILKKFSWQAIKLQSKEGLALLNGTQFMSSYGIWALLKAHKLVKAADLIAAMSLEAYDGRIEPFDVDLHTIRPHNGQIATAKNFLKILEGSEIIKQHKEHVQDPYSFRCIPQVHGATKDTLDYVTKVVTTEINSVTDNPTVFVDKDKILSGGNFHGEPLALVYDFLAIAMSELGNISERRIYRLISGSRNLPAFLVAKPGLNSGFMIPQYTAASLVSQNKQLATPASVDSISSSNEQEDHVSMGANAATKLVRVIDNVEKILAIELLNAAQALEFRRPLKSSPTIEKLLKDFRQNVKFVENDRLMHTNIKKSIEFIQQREF